MDNRTNARRQFLFSTLLATTSAVMAGCGGGSGADANAGTGGNNTASANPQPVPAGTLTPATATISASVSGAIGTAFAGLSYEKAQLHGPLFSASNTDLIGLFQRLGPSVLRIGGNTVDQNVWTPAGAGKTPGQIAPADVTALAAFVKASGWKCLYGINLGGSATGATTPALAAQEVAYVAQAFGTSLLGVEIGNECDLYGDTGNYYAASGLTLAQFVTLWRQYRTAILATTPGVPITGPASATHDATWTVPFGQAVTSSEITLLTQHYYRANGALASSTAAYLVTPDSALVSNLATLKAGASAIGVPFRMSECNSYYNGGASGVSDSYASALWVIDYLFNCAQGGADGVNLHGGGNGAGYTPIANNGAAIVEARPEYYGVLLFTLAGVGSLLQTQLDAGSLNATAYTVKKAAGGVSLVIVNKESTQSLQLTVNLPQSFTTVAILEMSQQSAGLAGPNLAATTGVTIQGATVSVDGNFVPGNAYTAKLNGNSLSCYVPALSAILVQLS